MYPERARKTLFWDNDEPMKLWVSSMYEVPVFSAVIWMLPLAGRKGHAWQFNRTHNPYATNVWHRDACCHPRPGGHLILSLVIAYCLVEEEKAMRSHGARDAAEGERDFTMDAEPILRDPLYLSPEEDEMYVTGDQDGGGVDFTDSDGEDAWRDSIAANEGWVWYADNKDKDKFGFIADGVEGGQHIAVSLTGGKYGRVEVAYVVSYENFGNALAWLDEWTANIHSDTLCKVHGKVQKHGNAADHRLQDKPQTLSASWDVTASLPKNELLRQRLEEGANAMLHVCLTPLGKPKRGRDQKDPKNKFKLLGVRVY